MQKSERIAQSAKRIAYFIFTLCTVRSAPGVPVVVFVLVAASGCSPGAKVCPRYVSWKTKGQLTKHSSADFPAICAKPSGNFWRDYLKQEEKELFGTDYQEADDRHKQLVEKFLLTFRPQLRL
jgi:hypothetical protein